MSEDQRHLWHRPGLKVGEWNRVQLALLAFLLALSFGIRPLEGYDLWWQIASGAWVVEHGQVPQTDPFSYTAQGQPWMHHEWGSGVLFWLFFSTYGAAGLLALNVLVFFGYLYFAGRSAQILSGSSRTPFIVLLLLAFLSVHRFNPRPHIFTNFLIALVFYLLYRSHYGENKNQRLVWLLPGLFLPWTSLHGGVLLGLGVMGLFWLGRVIDRYLATKTLDLHRPLLFVVLIAAGVVLINPYSWHVFTFPFEHLHLANIMAGTQEWQSPLRAPWRFLVVFQGYLVLLVATFGLMVLGRKHLRLEILLIGLVFTYLSLRHNRFTALFALWALPVSAGIFNSTYFLKERATFLWGSRARWVVGCATLLAAAFFLKWGVPVHLGGGWTQPTIGIMPASVPQETVDFLTINHLERGRVFNELGLGNYLILAGIPVFIDGRTPLYGDEAFTEYQRALVDANTFERLWSQWDFGIVVLSRGREKDLRYLHGYLMQHPEWDLVHYDDVAYVYLDRREQHLKIIAKHRLTKSPVLELLAAEGVRINP